MSTMMSTANHYMKSTFCEPCTSSEEAKEFMMESNPTLYSLYWLYFGCIPIPLLLLATPCTVAYILAICAALHARRVSRKCYMLLLNRAVGDLLCCACFFCCSLYIFIVGVEQFRVSMLFILVTLSSGCCWTSMVSYVFLSVLKLFAVYQPLRYKKVFSMSRCLYLVAFSWLVYVLIVLVTLTSFALVEVPSLRKWSGCERKTCMQVVAGAKNITLITTYVVTLAIYGITVALLRMAHRSSNSLQSGSERRRNSRSRSRFPFWKLTLNVATFAIFNFFYVVVAIVLMPCDRCSVLVYRPEMIGLIGIIWSSLLVRILIDAVLGLCIDQQLRQSNTNGPSRSNTSTRSHIKSDEKVVDRRASLPLSVIDVCPSRSESVTRR